MPDRMRVATVDYHTAGEPFRIVLDGAPDIEGATILERREFASRTASVDAYRQLLVQEPRGHADMYGCFLVPPDDDGAHLGVLFWHKDGYSTACGHGTIALGAWAVESGRVPSPPTGVTDVVIDVPSGRVTAHVTTVDGAVDARRVRERGRLRRGPRRRGRDQPRAARASISATAERSTRRSRPRASGSA